jgi:EthD domain-containing protein
MNFMRSIAAGVFCAALLGGPALADDPVFPEDTAPLQSTAVGWWRPDLSKEEADAYWRDVHGTLVARAPGLYSYRQLQLGRPISDLWPSLTAVGIDTAPDGPERIDGMNQMLFCTQHDVETLAHSDLVRQYVLHDEHNFARANATMWSAPREAVTLTDRTGIAVPQGRATAPSYAVLFRRLGTAEAGAFKAFILEAARRWATAPGVLRLRVQILQPYDPAGSEAPGVEHRWPLEHQYQAWIELSTDTETAARALAGEDFSDRAKGLISAVHVYPIEARYTIVWQGRPTDVGLRGWPAVETIIKAGADNQRGHDLLHAVFGSAADGHVRKEAQCH